MIKRGIEKMKNITELVIKLSEEFKLPVHIVLRDVHKVEEKLFDNYLLKININARFETTFYCSAIGYLRNEYRENKKIIEELKNV